jgi:hypothetical protein
VIITVGPPREQPCCSGPWTTFSARTGPITNPLAVTPAMQVSGQRPGKASGPWNRLLCRSVPVLSRYAGIRTARLTGACRASRPAVSPPCCSSWAAGWSCSYLRPGQACWIGPRPPIEAVTEAATECAPPLGLDPAEPVVYLSWTGDTPVMYPPHSCAGDRPDHEAEVPACGCSERDGRPAAVEPSNRTDVPGD